MRAGGRGATGRRGHLDQARVARAFRLGLGSTLLATGSGGRVLGGSIGVHLPGEALPAEPVIDLAVGIADAMLQALHRTLTATARTLGPLTRPAARPLLELTEQLTRAVAAKVQPVQARGRQRRLAAEEEVAALVEAFLPVITDLVMERLDLAALLDKIDVQEVMEASIPRVDVTSLIEQMDVETAIEATMQRVDMTEIALRHVDMRRMLDAAMDQVDMVAVMRKQLDGVDLADLIRTTPTSLAGGALRQTTRFVRRG